MKIHYVKNAWGHCMPIYFDKCCDTMAHLFSPEKKPIQGFWFDNSDATLKEFSRGKIVGRVTRCWYCHKDIEIVERELKDENI